jgi:hypothetical protein
MIGRGLAAVLGLIVIYLALIYAASESGEVVQLVTQDSQGQEATTRLWVAEDDGSMWLRADQGSGWYQRLITHDAQNPAKVIRGDQRYEVVAKAEHVQIARLNALMAEKYGLGDSVVAALAGSPENGVAVRLVPAATED